MDETPKNLWKGYDDKYQFHVTIPIIDSTIESKNVDERVIYIGDVEKRKQAYGICGEYFLNEIKSHLQIHLIDIVQFQTTSYTAQSTSANPISECLDVQLSELLELNEICQDDEHNIE
ncbi:kinase-like domain-containing protein [Rhizophagus irregularis DAOM 181602=DAOM 197198]|nr:kinase-like domain-containing protein [Rhizophagus irregularis DAOM 181602=DAOM 197198]